jgi:putative membrane protein
MKLLNTIHCSKGELAAIATIWLFHVCGIIGTSLGYGHWFTPKTPLLLCIMSAILILFFPIKQGRVLLAAALFFIAGMWVEWIGIRHDFLFGSYYYGNNLGIKFGGVPLLIGANWMILVFVTSYIAAQLSSNTTSRILLGSALMVFLDFFIERSAPIFDFWIWRSGTPPLRNYTSWFGIALVLHSVAHFLKIESKSTMSWHLYLSQLVFFIYFYGFHSI